MANDASYPASYTEAEADAPGGDRESQDSQLVLDAYLRQYGTGTRTSTGTRINISNETGPRALVTPVQRFNRSKPSNGAHAEANRSLQRAIILGSDPATAVSSISRPRLRSRTLTEIEIPPGQDRSSGSPACSPLRRESTGAGAGAASVAVRGARPTTICSVLANMDYADSPTQSNGSRSYQGYLSDPGSEGLDLSIPDTLPAASRHNSQDLTQTTPHGLGSLEDEDTGAVKFNLGSVAEDHPVESPALEGSGLLGPGDGTFSPPGQAPTQLVIQGPETPAQNPFANSRSQLIPSSQLFKGTQPSSAVRLQISPTSSRPSPNHLPHNSISPNVLSSPVKARGLRELPSDATCSPHITPKAMSPTIDELEDESDHPRYTNGPAPSSLFFRKKPEEPELQSRQALGNLGTYVPMQNSQDRRSRHSRRSTPKAAPDPTTQDSSSDEDSVVDRRRKARYRKEAALKQLTSISFNRLPSSTEAPFTGSKERRSGLLAQNYLHSRRRSIVETPNNDLEAQETVENSQAPLVTSEGATTPRRSRSKKAEAHCGTWSPAAERGNLMMSSVPEHMGGRTSSKLPRLSADIDSSTRDAIPETSPVGKRAGQHLSMSPAEAARPPRFSNPVTGSMPTEAGTPGDPSLAPTRALGPGSSALRVPESRYSGSPAPTSLVPPSPRLREGEADSSPRLPAPSTNPASFASSPPALNAAGGRKRPGSSPRDHTSARAPGPAPQADTLSSTNSALSPLGSTPSLSTNTTPATPASLSVGAVSSDAQESDGCSRALARKRRRLMLGGLPKPSEASEERSSRSSSRLSARRQSYSTDELARSPPAASTPEESLGARAPAPRRGPPPAKPQHAPKKQHGRGQKVFEGMAFAISFQSRRPGESTEQYSQRLSSARDLRSKMTQAGGRILDAGFEELFQRLPVAGAGADPPPSRPPPGSEIELTADARALGFTALIADGHSRKVKYMQSLALGLPCVASRWAAACLERGELVDWAPYLLCAGQSSFLGGAIRSRNLAPYDARTATLARAVARRPRFLAGSRILLVMRRSEEGRKMAYVFLARALGASLSRARSLDDARAQLAAAERAARPFDWVYIDGRAAGRARLAEGATRKRMRGVAAAAAAPAWSPPPSIRTLSDELVIQSLILGRLIEEGEWEEGELL